MCRHLLCDLVKPLPPPPGLSNLGWKGPPRPLLQALRRWRKPVTQQELLPCWTLTLLASHCDLGKLLLPLALGLPICPDNASPACLSVKPQVCPARTKGSSGFQALC